RPLREGRGPEPDGYVQGTRNGGRGSDGLRSRRLEPRGPDRGQRGRSPRSICRDLWREVANPIGERRLGGGGARGRRLRSVRLPVRGGHFGCRTNRKGSCRHDRDIQLGDASRAVPRGRKEDDAVRNLGSARRPPDWIVFPTGGGTGIVG